MDNATLFRGLTNIGPTIAERLDAVGLRTLGQLRRIGPATAFLRVRTAYPDIAIPVCYYLYSLQGALENRHWDALALSTKRRLLSQAVLDPRRAS